MVVAHRSYGEAGQLTFKVFSIGKEFKIAGEMNAKQDGVPSFRNADGNVKFESHHK